MYWLSQSIYHYILTGTTNVKYFCHFKVDVNSLLKLKHIAACAHAYTSVSILIKNNYIRVLPVGVFIEAIGPSLFYRLREREREREREGGGGVETVRARAREVILVPRAMVLHACRPCHSCEK